MHGRLVNARADRCFVCHGGLTGLAYYSRATDPPWRREGSNLPVRQVGRFRPKAIVWRPPPDISCRLTDGRQAVVLRAAYTRGARRTAPSAKGPPVVTGPGYYRIVGPQRGRAAQASTMNNPIRSKFCAGLACASHSSKAGMSPAPRVCWQRRGSTARRGAAALAATFRTWRRPILPTAK
jgi:hypothetical protein